MCPRCTRHLEIFGVEWPKRIGKRPAKSKTKGVKANQKKDLGVKQHTKPNGESLTSKQPSDEASGMKLNLLDPKTNQQGGLLLDRPENTPSIDTTDTTDTTMKKPEKPKAIKHSYYYELVRIDEVPEPEPILEHPTKPYALRRKANENDACKSPSATTEVVKTRPVSRRPKRKPVQRVKKPKETPSPTTDVRSGRPPKHKTDYYFYEVVLENDSPEETPIIEVPDQPYPFRSRGNKIFVSPSEYCTQLEMPGEASSVNKTSIHLRTYVTENPDNSKAPSNQPTSNEASAETSENTHREKRALDREYEPLSKRTCP